MSNPSLPSEYLQKIHSNSWFSSLPAAIQEDMLSQVTVKKFSKGEYLFRRGDRISETQFGFCVLAQGRMQVSCLHSNGREFVVTIHESGHWFGEIPFLLDIKQTHDFIAVEKCVLLSISHSQFTELLLLPDFSLPFMRQMASRMVQFSILLENVCVLDSHELVAKRLYQAARGDTAELDAPLSKVSVSQDTLAAMVGMTRQTLQKELKVLTDAKIIACRYGYIDVLDFKKLAALAYPRWKFTQN